MLKKQPIDTLRRGTVLINLILVLALLVAFVPSAAIAADPAQTDCTVKHTVKSGETLSSIALTYGVDWLAIAQANDLKDPYVIFVGQVLCIPGGSTSTDGSTSDTSGTTTSGKDPTFTVIASDKYEHFIRIQTVNYPPNRSHIVRLSTDEGRFSVTSVVGRFSTNKNGGSDAYIRLPRMYRDQVLVVCLKNAFTDLTQCQVYDPFDEG